MVSYPSFLFLFISYILASFFFIYAWGSTALASMFGPAQEPHPDTFLFLGAMSYSRFNCLSSWNSLRFYKTASFWVSVLLKIFLFISRSSSFSFNSTLWGWYLSLRFWRLRPFVSSSMLSLKRRVCWMFFLMNYFF